MSALRPTRSETAARRVEILRLYDSGLSGVEISRRLGIGDATVWRALRAKGVPRRPRGRPQHTPEQRSRAVALYAEGISMRAVGQAVGVDDQTVKRILDAAGVALRPDSIRPTYGAETKAAALDLYVRERKSAKAVAAVLGLKPHTVKEWLTEAGAIRSMSEAATLATLAGKPRGRNSVRIAWKSTKTGRTELADSALEAARMRQHDEAPGVLDWMRCRDAIPWIDTDGRKRLYTPDLLVIRVDGTRAVEEVKGAHQLTDARTLAKAQAASAFYEVLGIAYRIVPPNEIEWRKGDERFFAALRLDADQARERRRERQKARRAIPGPVRDARLARERKRDRARRKPTGAVAALPAPAPGPTLPLDLFGDAA